MLYRADWSTGPAEWPEIDGWRILDGRLHNNGSGAGLLTTAPLILEDTADYAVEAEIQVVGTHGFQFGLFLRSGYKGGVDLSFPGPPIALLRTLRGGQEQELGRWWWALLSPFGTWNTYRLEARGSAIRILLNGMLVAELLDDGFRDGGRVGLWSKWTPLIVRDFKVSTLQS